jgi:hypothetical protein
LAILRRTKVNQQVHQDHFFGVKALHLPVTLLANLMELRVFGVQ